MEYMGDTTETHQRRVAGFLRHGELLIVLKFNSYDIAMKKLLLIGTVVACVIFLIKLHHEEEEYVTIFGIVPQKVAASISGSIIGSGILMIFFSDCNS